MKSYFSDNGATWLEEASEVTRKIDKFLKDLYNEEAAKGYNFRELTCLALHSVSTAECRTAIDASKKQQNPEDTLHELSLDQLQEMAYCVRDNELTDDEADDYIGKFVAECKNGRNKRKKSI